MGEGHQHHHQHYRLHVHVHPQIQILLEQGLVLLPDATTFECGAGRFPAWER